MEPGVAPEAVQAWAARPPVKAPATARVWAALTRPHPRLPGTVAAGVRCSMTLVLLAVAARQDMAAAPAFPGASAADVAALTGLSADRCREQLARWREMGWLEVMAINQRYHYRISARL